MGADARRGLVREECLLTVHTHYGESSKNLEGVLGRDRVQQCRLLTPEIVLLRKKYFFKFAIEKANCVIVDKVNYLML